MKKLITNRKELQAVGRWDIDYHLPPEGIKRFPAELLKRVDEVADFPKSKRDPTKAPDEAFLYIDISSVDVTTGAITNPQEVEGSDAPSRARKVVRAFDLLISTCRPTRGAIAVVPPTLHDQIASTGFSVIRAKEGINPFYLHYALRLASTLEQFRKWSTGSSYPAILDADVAKTLIPVPAEDVQNEIAHRIIEALALRNEALHRADHEWAVELAKITSSLTGTEEAPMEQPVSAKPEAIDTTSIAELINSLPALRTDAGATVEAQEQVALFEDE